jgi:hypothetical protein
VEPLNLTPTSSDAWGDVEDSGERFGKAQSATPRNQGQPTTTFAFAKLEGERWRDECGCRGYQSSWSGWPTLLTVLLTWFRPFDRSHSLQRMVQYTPCTFLTIEQNLS